MLSTRTAVITAATIVFVSVSVLPLLVMVLWSWPTNNVKATALAALLLDARQRTLLYNTSVLGLSTAVLATMIGTPLGIALARIDLPRKRAFRVLLAAPMLLPPYLAALAWVSLGGPTGLVAGLVGRDLVSRWTYSMSGAVVVLALVFYPVSMLTTEAAVRRIEPHLEEAALIVTSARGVLWRITLRLAAPSIAAAALVIFVLAVADFAVPGLLRVRVFTTEVFTAFAALYDFGRAIAMAVPLLLLPVAVAAITAAIVGEQFVTTRRALGGEVGLFLRWKSGAVLAAVIVVAVALIIPVVLLAHEASGVRSWTAVVDGSSAAIGNSLVFATAGATLTTGVGLVLGYARARAPRRMAFVADLVFVLLLAVPSTIVGIGLIALWNRPGPIGTVYGSKVMLVIAYMARFVPVAALGMAAAFRRVPRSHEEAAATAGAGWISTLTHVVIPQVSTGLMAVWVVVFVLAFGELGASILIAPPGESTLPIRIYTLIANAPPAEVAALGLLQTAVILSPLLLLAAGIAARDQR